MIHLTYFSHWLLRHWGRPAGMLVAWAGGDEFCPCHHQAATEAKWIAGRARPCACCLLPCLIFPTGACPVGFPQGTLHLE